MPELPEVETVKEILKTQILGKKITDIKILYDGIIKCDLNYFVDSLKNKTFKDITRRGKFLIFELDDVYLVGHLRMEGKFFIKKQTERIVTHEHVLFYLDDGTSLRYHDTRKFGTMEIKTKEELFTTEPLSRLGYEPFDENLCGLYLMQRFSKMRKTIKEALLDQTIMTGLGNIYVDEVCFLTHLNPMRRACDISFTECEEIIENARITLTKAIKAGGTTIRSYTSSLGVTGLFQLQLLVHTKENEPCPCCSATIIKTKVGGRGTYYCPNCQKLV